MCSFQLGWIWKSGERVNLWLGGNADRHVCGSKCTLYWSTQGKVHTNTGPDRHHPHLYTSARMFVSGVGPLQVWSHHGRKQAGGRRGCRCGWWPSGPVSVCPFSCASNQQLHGFSGIGHSQKDNGPSTTSGDRVNQTTRTAVWSCLSMLPCYQAAKSSVIMMLIVANNCIPHLPMVTVTLQTVYSHNNEKTLAKLE